MMVEREMKKQAGETEEASIQREAHVNVSVVPMVSPSRSRGIMRSRVGLAIIISSTFLLHQAHDALVGGDSGSWLSSTPV